MLEKAAKDFNLDLTKCWMIGDKESDILAGKISYQSPLGQRLMGQVEGKEFDFMAGNKRVKVKILEIN